MPKYQQNLGNRLKTGQLKEIFKHRTNRIHFESTDDEDLLKQLGEDLPFNKELQDLIQQTLTLDADGKKRKPKSPKPKPPPEKFHGKRYPSFFHIDSRLRGDTPVARIPNGDSKTVTFESDVEDHYFDRTVDPGGLEFAIMTYAPNDASGGNQKGSVNEISEFLSVTKRSPKNGKIRIVFEPTEDVRVGDMFEIQADLHSSANPDDLPPVLFWIEIVEPRKQSKPKPPPKEKKLGIPQLIPVYKSPKDGMQHKTWEDLQLSGIEMDHAVVMHPEVEGDKLKAIFINMDSKTLLDFKGKIRNPSETQIHGATRQYKSRVYYHTLFLYLISKNRNYGMSRMNSHDVYDPVDLSDYLKDVFQSHYAEFLLNFESSAMILG